MCTCVCMGACVRAYVFACVHVFCVCVYISECVRVCVRS